jgi:hypothetical protein
LSQSCGTRAERKLKVNSNTKNNKKNQATGFLVRKKIKLPSNKKALFFSSYRNALGFFLFFLMDFRSVFNFDFYFDRVPQVGDITL